ncbi:hypothetical protein PMI14_05730 [Acidovorax sp. CF316]|uniref:hypothetical protein n=1 Tax=Acidovorax sp. CF316 TaxID=1144317 RepID=UPI00026BEF3C|nr:hypothetical protein [Acidovorax sp. CF316]EJE49725.1 hypothetical protein PMI14_05730 [Acidovorax sp. CF316]
MPTDASYRPHLRRTGLALLIVGGIDIAAWLICLAFDVPYVSSFNIFSVAGGIFLLRGSLRAASIVRRMAMSMLALLAAVVLVSPLLQPPGLTLVMVKAHAGLAALGGVLLVFTVVLMAWLARELGAPPVRAAIAAAGLKVRSTRWPIAMGVGIALLLAAMGTALQHTDAAARAIREARAANGDGYQYHLSLIQARETPAGREITGTVSAWNEHELRTLPFSWRQ